MRPFPFLFLLLAMIWNVPTMAPVQAQSNVQSKAQNFRKVALVIGNSQYKTGGLANPVNDANSVKTALETLGFDVTKQVNRDKGQMEDDIDAVTGNLNQGDICFVFYAGHGVSVGQANFLVPIGAELSTKNHIKRRCVELDYLLGALDESRASMKVVVLDCCRDNPFRSITRSKTGGMASIEPPNGTIVTFSTAPGKVALDGAGANSPFTKHLVKTIESEHPRGLTIVDMFRQTARAVKQETKQRPYMRHDISMDEYFVVQPSNLSTDATPIPKIAGPRKSITNSIGMRFRRIPAGTFMMGSSDSEAGRDKDEFQHEVAITRPFYMRTFEVTRGQFRKFVEATGFKTEAEKDGKGGYGYDEASTKFAQDPKYSWRSTGFDQTDTHPVVNVSWNDAVKFGQWLSKKEGKTYRLPTEAQWEYACRAGTSTIYHFGDDPKGLAKHGNVADGTLKKKFDGWDTIKSSDGAVFTAAVGNYRPNGFGLYDMHGNVWEWCSDFYGENYYKTSEREDPDGSSDGSFRVSRGGCWGDIASLCRSADRSRRSSGYRLDSMGFRLVLVQE